MTLLKNIMRKHKFKKVICTCIDDGFTKYYYYQCKMCKVFQFRLVENCKYKNDQYVTIHNYPWKVDYPHPSRYCEEILKFIDIKINEKMIQQII